MAWQVSVDSRQSFSLTASHARRSRKEAKRWKENEIEKALSDRVTIRVGDRTYTAWEALDQGVLEVCSAKDLELIGLQLQLHTVVMLKDINDKLDGLKASP